MIAYRGRRLLWGGLRSVRDTLTFSTALGRFTVYTRDEAIGRDLFCLRSYELDMIEAVTSFLRGKGRLQPESTLVDVGANIGVIAVGMLSLGHLRRAVAVEPEPRNVDLLRRNISQNGMDARIWCVAAAVGDARGTIDFELSETNYGDHRIRRSEAGGVEEKFSESGRAVTTVPLDTLDDTLAAAPREFTERIGLVWMDVQGAELLVLRGAERLLASGVPVFCEVWPYGMKRAGTSLQDLSALVARHWTGFHVFQSGEFVRRPVSEFPAFLSDLRGSRFENVLFVD